MSDSRERLRIFVTGSVGTSELRDADDIFEMGRTTSLFAMELVMFLEKEFGITLDDEDLERDNFRSIDAMAALVERKRGT